jgi:putative MATE family efflux protein
MANKDKKYEIDMCNGTLLDKLISFAFPLMLSGILQLMFNAVDIIVVGNFSGSQALAAVGSTTSLINLFINLFIGISLGANVLAARYYAAGKDKEMSETVHSAMALALISGVVMLFVGLIFARGALELMDTPDDVIDQSTLYMRIYFLGMPFFMMYNYGAAILRAVGDTKRPLLFLVIAGIVNAGLNMFLVIVFHLGVAGVAISTVISQMISCVLVIICLYRTQSSYQLRFSKLKLRWEYIKQICKVGIPAGVQSMVINFSNVLLQSSVNSFGSIAMAGYTAANNIFGFLFASINSVTQACMSFTSQNYSVGKYKRMTKVLFECIGLSMAVSLTLGCSAYFFGNKILWIYTDNAAVVKAGMEVLTYSTVTYFLCGIMDLFPGALRGMGYSTVPMILSVVGTVGTRLVWIYGVFPKHRSLDVLFISYPASWFITIVFQVICYIIVRKKLGIAARKRAVRKQANSQ